MSGPNPELYNLLRLTLIPGLGPVLIARAVAALGSAREVLETSEAGLKRIKGIGREKARAIAAGRDDSRRLADEELALAARLGVSVMGIGDGAYPPLLRQIPDAPPVLYTKGRLDPGGLDRYPVAIVGSRSCTHYGVEQAERFAGHLAASGLTVVSGGARGIDTAAHRAALRASGRTIAVLGCGLAHRYPPDNAELFDRICSDAAEAGQDRGRGALVSELPLNTPPTSENFPARNRIISGLSLGVLVVEAGRRSGALITARHAAEEHGREVFAVPGRVDSAASEGSLHLLKAGGAALVTHPADIVEILENAARHHFNGTHGARYGGMNVEGELFEGSGEGQNGLAEAGSPSATAQDGSIGMRDAGLTESQLAILGALDEPLTVDELARTTGLEPARLRADVTVLEIGRRVKRAGSKLAKVP